MNRKKLTDFGKFFEIQKNLKNQPKLLKFLKFIRRLRIVILFSQWLMFNVYKKESSGVHFKCFLHLSKRWQLRIFLCQKYFRCATPWSIFETCQFCKNLKDQPKLARIWQTPIKIIKTFNKSRVLCVYWKEWNQSHRRNVPRAEPRALLKPTIFRKKTRNSQ